MAVSVAFACDPIPDLAWFDSAEERVVLDAELDCSPAELFAIFEDPDAWPRWVSSIVRVEWTSPKPFRKGTTRTVHVRGGLVVEEEFLVWNHGSVMAFAFTRASMRIWRRMGERYEVTERTGGRCALRWTIGYEPRGLFALAHPFIRPLMRRSLGELRDALVVYVRERPSSG